MVTYHVIPHTHWDREWYLSFDHFRVMLVHLLDDLLDILEKRSDFESFTLDGQTVVLDDYLEVRPEQRDRIERLVRQGRLHVGPWYVLPDEFLVSGEATIRNLIRGREAARGMGRSMDVGYIPDSFGHIGQMPQILRGFGIETAIVWRGFGGEPGQEPSEYHWRAPDGSTVLMEHLSDSGYSGAYFNTTDADEVRRRFAAFRPHVDARARTSERLVLSGGDHHWPFAGLPDVVRTLNDESGEDVRLKMSALPEFVEALQVHSNGAVLPTVEGELRFGYRWAFNVTGGVYSSRMYVKQANTRGQWLLERYLEPMNVLAVRRGARSQSALIRLGWTYLMKNHPHDSICGCSIDPVHREMMSRFEKLEELGRGVERFAWMELAHNPEGDPGDDKRLTLFNPSPFPRSEVVECDVEFFRRKIVVGLNPDVQVDEAEPPVAGFALEDVEGRRVPFEVIERTEGFGLALTRFDYPSQTLVDRFRIRLPMEDLPPLGLRSLGIVRTESFDAPEHSNEMLDTAGGVRTESRAIENRFVRVEVGDDGAFYVLEKESGRRYGPLGRLEDGGDEGDEYNYSPPTDDRVVTTEGVDVEVSSNPGVYQAELRIQGTWSLPTGLSDDRRSRSAASADVSLVTTAMLTAFSRHVRFETVVDNTVRDHRLRLLVATGCRTNTHRADGQFAIVEREQRAFAAEDYSIEVPASVAPMQRFVTVEDTERAATLIAVGLPEYELKHDSGGILALTLLRCTGELAQGALNWRPGGRAGWKNSTPDAQCLGRHTFQWGFLPHEPGAYRGPDDLNRAAECIHLPVRVHRGKNPRVEPDTSFVSIEPVGLVLSALKEAEDGDGVVLRIHNPSPENVDGRVRFGFPPTSIIRTNLEEEGDEEVPMADGGFDETWAPYRIQTFRLRYKSSQ